MAAQKCLVTSSCLAWLRLRWPLEERTLSGTESACSHHPFLASSRSVGCGSNPKVLGPVVVPRVAVFVLAPCGMNTAWHRRKLTLTSCREQGLSSQTLIATRTSSHGLFPITSRSVAFDFRPSCPSVLPVLPCSTEHTSSLGTSFLELMLPVTLDCNDGLAEFLFSPTLTSSCSRDPEPPNSKAGQPSAAGTCSGTCVENLLTAGVDVSTYASTGKVWFMGKGIPIQLLSNTTSGDGIHATARRPSQLVWSRSLSVKLQRDLTQA